jgi:hypothetical protein
MTVNPNHPEINLIIFDLEIGSLILVDAPAIPGPPQPVPSVWIIGNVGVIS